MRYGGTGGQPRSDQGSPQSPQRRALIRAGTTISLRKKFTMTTTTNTPHTASLSPDERAAFEQHMAARREALKQAYVVLDRESELAIEYGDALHLVTVLQRAIAAHDICLFGDSSQEQPIDACAGYNQMRNDADALAHLAQAFYDSEWRQIRRIEAGVSIDD